MYCYSFLKFGAPSAALFLAAATLACPVFAQEEAPEPESEASGEAEPSAPVYPGESGSESSEEVSDAQSEAVSPQASDEAHAEVGESSEVESGKDAKNTVYLELFGPGLLYSLNYERRIEDVNLRVGVGGAAWQGAGYLTVPVGVTYTGIGNELHHFEVGATGTFIFADDSFSTASTFAFQPILGYRRQSKEGGYSFRAGISPWVSSSGLWPWGYVSFGFGF